MIIPDKKRLGTMIAVHIPKMDEGGEVDGDSYESLASQVLDAIKSDSASDLAEALKAFFMECESGESEGDGE